MERAKLKKKPELDRRLTSRVPAGALAQFQVVFPDATFTPVVLFAQIQDIIRKGARLKLSEVSPSHSRKIILGPRFCRLICKFPISPQATSRLFGKISNFNFQSIGDGDAFYVGVEFADNEDSDWARLDEFLAELGRSNQTTKGLESSR